jgi:hypothetical protein
VPKHSDPFEGEVQEHRRIHLPLHIMLISNIIPVLSISVLTFHTVYATDLERDRYSIASELAGSLTIVPLYRHTVSVPHTVVAVMK